MNEGRVVLPDCMGNLKGKEGVSFAIRKSGHAYYNLSLCLVREGSKGWSNQNNAYGEILGAGC